MKKIIGLVGPIASGKDVVKKYIEEKYGAESVKFSQILRDVLNRLNVPIERKNLQVLSTSLMDIFGRDILAKNIVIDAQKKDSDIVILDGVRRMDDISHAKKLGSFTLISIDADPRIRFERSVSRNENEGDDKKKFDEFLNDHKSLADIEVESVIKKAKYKINNNGDINSLYKQVDDIISQL